MPDFDVFDLIEVFVPRANRVQELWRLHDRDLIGLCSDPRDGFIGRDRGRNNHVMSARLTRRPDGSHHCGARREPVVDEHYGPAAQVQRRQAAAIGTFAALNFGQLPLRKSFEMSIKPVSTTTARLTHEDPARSNRTDRELRLARHADLAHDENIDWRMQGIRHLASNRNASPGKREHQNRRLQLQFQNDGRQSTARLGAIHEAIIFTFHVAHANRRMHHAAIRENT